MDMFILYALLAGIGIALMTGALGTFIVWRNMAYFGEAVSHAALLGVAMGFAFHMHLTIGIIFSAVTMALVLMALQRRSVFSADTLIGILAQGALAAGIVAVSLMRDIRIDLNAYLFGDILTVDRLDLAIIYGMALVVNGLLILFWKPLLLTTIHAPVARVQGIKVERLNAMLMLLIALSVAIAIKVVGMLLITAMLILPAAIARRFSSTPTQMAIGSIAFGIMGVVGGIAASFHFDTPGGATIVLVLVGLFSVAQLRSRIS